MAIAPRGLLGSIPSPSSGALEIGPISLNAYGLMIALGVVAAVWLFGRRLEERNIGTREDANAIGVWGVIAGVIGARLYHVVTDWQRFEGNYGEIIAVWRGGLGIPGGMLAGVVVGVYVAHRRGLPIGPALNAVAPSLPLAQAIGRWGNWFNQELFGRATNLPWALEIDDQHLPAGYESGTTFHPTFLYESIWNLLLFGLLLWIDKHRRLAGGQLLAIYVLGYGVGRFWIEGLRIDAAHHVGGLRWNQWVALACIVGGGLYLLFTIGSPREQVYERKPEPLDTDDDETAASAVATAGLDLDDDLDDLDEHINGGEDEDEPVAAGGPATAIGGDTTMQRSTKSVVAADVAAVDDEWAPGQEPAEIADDVDPAAAAPAPVVQPDEPDGPDASGKPDAVDAPDEPDAVGGPDAVVAPDGPDEAGRPDTDDGPAEIDETTGERATGEAGRPA